jgi:fermentation-respiration switch protein FrsA (DUF1100 family)
MAELRPAYRIFPLNLIVHQRFDSLEKVRELKVPVIYFHGTEDRLIPYTMTQNLYRFTASAKKVKLIPGGGHNNSALVGDQEYLQSLRNFFEFTQSLLRGNDGQW